MYCLSEVVPAKEGATFTPFRKTLENQLSQWLLFECHYQTRSYLAGEMELPEHVLDNILRNESEDIQIIVLKSLSTRPKIPLGIITLATDWLKYPIFRSPRIAIHEMLRGPHEALPSRSLEALAARLEDEDWHVRRTAADALSSQSALPEEILKAMEARLGNKDASVRRAAVITLSSQLALPEEILKTIAARVENEDEDVRRAAFDVLRGRLSVSEMTINRVVRPLYRYCLERSFKERLSCYIADNTFYINDPEGLTSVRLEDRQDHFRQKIQEAQKSVGIPISNDLGM